MRERIKNTFNLQIENRFWQEAGIRPKPISGKKHSRVFYVNAPSVVYLNDKVKEHGYIVMFLKTINEIGYPEKEVYSDKIEGSHLVALYSGISSGLYYIIHDFARINNNHFTPANLTRSERQYLHRRGVFQREFS